MGKRKLTAFTESTIAIPLSEAEQRAKAFELAKVCGDIDGLKADVAASAHEGRKKIRALTKQQRLLAECVRTGTEQRPSQLEIGVEKGNGSGPRAA